MPGLTLSVTGIPFLDENRDKVEYIREALQGAKRFGTHQGQDHRSLSWKIGCSKEPTSGDGGCLTPDPRQGEEIRWNPSRVRGHTRITKTYQRSGRKLKRVNGGEGVF